LRGIDAVTSNRALFHYRQVKAFDVVLVRSLLEAFVYFIVSGVLTGVLALWHGRGADKPAAGHAWLLPAMGFLNRNLAHSFRR
jgi:ABC-type polysaccharide/polyol phosphate export permease